MKTIVVQGKKVRLPYGIHSAAEWVISRQETLKKITGTKLDTPSVRQKICDDIAILKMVR